MKEFVENYIQAIGEKFKHEETSELGYRSDFESLLQKIFESIKIKRINHDAKAKEGNKPDFAVLSGDIPLVYIETKDIGVSLDKVEKSEQMSRYYGYANLVLTDYLEFRFYRNGLPYGESIKIANYDIKDRSISAISKNYEFLAKTLLEFTQSYKEPIKSGRHLSKIMGGKAQRIRDNIKEILALETGLNSELVNVYKTIKKLLVQDLTINSFADMYSQTLVYGLFVARFYDESLNTFSRQEARDLIPASNPFLGDFFDHIAGRNFEKKLSYIVDELCEVFAHSNVAELMERHFKIDSKKGTQRGQDQVIHFYEDFLKEYDDELRKKMGAYYTPLPVVQFIVRSVDYLIQKEFGLADGLASTSKTKDNIHRVQVLDPAVGTGTFISDVIGKIYEKVIKGGQDGRWPGYVHYNLLPRIHGFELMMAPYTIAHLKLSMTLKKTGFTNFYDTKKGKARLGIYLTNSLEEVSSQQDLLAFDFGASIVNEAEEASKIKNKTPIMVVVGNPPYSVSSSNKGDWIQNLTKDYKTNLNEKNIQPLSDDYIKFIRFSEYFIEKNKTGIVAMVTNNSFLDGIIHRQMRKHLLETFDDIYIVDLHGNSKKKEVNPNGGKDENVFDIQQGVSINIFVRKEKEKKGLGKVYHTDLYGKREYKFETLNKNNLKSIEWTMLNYSEPYYFFVPKDFELDKEYDIGFKIDELFLNGNMGLASGKDSEYVFFSEKEMNPVYKERLQVIHYHPFDNRVIYYEPQTLQRARYSIMKHYLTKEINLGLNVVKQSKGRGVEVLATNFLINRDFITNHTYTYPLYIYHDNETRTPNLDETIVSNLIGDLYYFYKDKKSYLQYVRDDKTKSEMISKHGHDREKSERIQKFIVSPLDILDYVYAVLHSPLYREKYKEFLKIDFPRIPKPKDADQFWNLVKLGSEIRSLHLLESSKLDRFITKYPEVGSDLVEKSEYKDGNVYINSEQYFGNVPEVAWNFWIGGYQPAQKWLKDRKGRQLTNDDIEHYQKIIVALTETGKIMKEVDKITNYD